jgi:hypothetical protein
MTGLSVAHTFPAPQGSEHWRDIVQETNPTSDLAWILPFFAVLIAAVGFFFWEVGQYTNVLG